MPFIGRIGRPGLLGLAARTAVVAGTATAVTGGMMRHQQRRAEEQYEAQEYQTEQAATYPVAATAPVAPSAPAAGDDLLARLRELGALHAQGVLSDDEFSAAKAKLLG